MGICGKAREILCFTPTDASLTANNVICSNITMFICGGKQGAKNNNFIQSLSIRMKDDDIKHLGSKALPQCLQSLG